MMSTLWAIFWELLLLILCISGVFCQSFSPPTYEICPGDNVTFTCVVVDSSVGSIGTTSWIVTPDGGQARCVLQHNTANDVDMCGPDERFTSSLTGQSEDSFTSTLSVQSIDDSLNGTTVQCEDTLRNPVGSKEICVVEEVFDAPEIDFVRFSLGKNECIVTVEWSEPFISCGGSVSQYVLSVTPPISDCRSGSGDCVLMTNEAQYDLTVTVDQTYNVTVRADICMKQLTSPLYNLNFTAQPRNCYYHTNFDREEIVIIWERVSIHVEDMFKEVANYRIGIIPVSGGEMMEDVTCNENICTYMYMYMQPFNDSYSVEVEFLACDFPGRIVCTNTSNGTSCDPDDDVCPQPNNTNRGDDDVSKLSTKDIAFIAIAVPFYIIGECIAVVLGTMLSMRARGRYDFVLAVMIILASVIFIPLAPILYFVMKKMELHVEEKKVTLRLWYRIMLVVSIINLTIGLGVWLALIIYVAILGDDFNERTVGGLVSGCFTCGIIVLTDGIVRAAQWRCGVGCCRDSPDGTCHSSCGPPKPKRSKRSKDQEAAEMDTYDVLNHGGKKPLVEQRDDQHYGKLDHGKGKGGTLPGAVPPASDGEYGKLDPTGLADYGKLGQNQSGPGEMYSTVTNEPRHKPKKTDH